MPSLVGDGFDFLERHDALLDLSRPDCRRSRTPSFFACSAMSYALPLRMIKRRMSSLIGMTW
jgi:hypothetical protein